MKQLMAKQMRRGHELRGREPSMWQTQAIVLWRAGVLLQEKSNAAAEEEIAEMLSGTSDKMKTFRLGEPESFNYLDQQLCPCSEMLLGFAIENALMGIIMSRCPELLTADGKLKKTVSGHNLERLWREDAKLPLSSEDSKILVHFTNRMEWSGRYTIPKDFDRFIRDLKVNLPRKEQSLAPSQEFFQSGVRLLNTCFAEYPNLPSILGNAPE